MNITTSAPTNPKVTLATLTYLRLPEVLQDITIGELVDLVANHYLAIYDVPLPTQANQLTHILGLPSILLAEETLVLMCILDNLVLKIGNLLDLSGNYKTQVVKRIEAERDTRVAAYKAANINFVSSTS